MDLNTFYVEGKVPSFNQVIAMTKTYWGNYAKLKRDWTNKVVAAAVISEMPPRDEIFLSLEWHEKNKRRDPDNISYAVKFVLDGLVKAEIIKRDGWGVVKGWDNQFSLSDEYGITISYA